PGARSGRRTVAAASLVPEGRGPRPGRRGTFLFAAPAGGRDRGRGPGARQGAVGKNVAGWARLGGAPQCNEGKRDRYCPGRIQRAARNEHGRQYAGLGFGGKRPGDLAVPRRPDQRQALSQSGGAAMRPQASLRQRGMAVIAALLVVVAASALATSVIERQGLMANILITERDRAQAAWLLRGGLDWSRVVLLMEARNSPT